MVDLGAITVLHRQAPRGPASKSILPPPSTHAAPTWSSTDLSAMGSMRKTKWQKERSWPTDPVSSISSTLQFLSNWNLWGPGGGGGQCQHNQGISQE